MVAARIDSLDDALAMLQSLAGQGASRDSIRSAFAHARRHYKRLEAIVEFYAPALAAAFNSRRQEVDDDDAPPPSSLSASGFPAVESALFAEGQAFARDSLLAATVGMRAMVPRLRSISDGIRPTASQRFELVRLELIRIATLEIAGFDTPRSKNAVSESADAAESLDEFIDVGSDTPNVRFRALLRREVAYLRAHPDFEPFDRLNFLSVYSERTLSALMLLRDTRSVVPLVMPRALRADAASPFAANAFDPMAYAPQLSPRLRGDVIALGERLFSEPALSGNGSRSCASCHVPARGFTDGLVKATSIRDVRELVARHTPTLLNAALQPRQFADERAVSLEDQIGLVLASPTEMGGSVEQAARAVAAKPDYRREFASAFKQASTSPSAQQVKAALAAYMRSLVRLDSRFDRAVRGDSGLLNGEERRGFNLFMGKAGCATCHFAPLFNGVTPPLYLNADVEVIGTPRVASNFALPDADSGRAHIDQLPLHVRAFKTPTVRNAALTRPYMHNGVFRSLEELLQFYNGGGGRGAGARIENQTLAPDSLHLSLAERQAIVAFIATLTDTSRARKPD